MKSFFKVIALVFVIFGGIACDKNNGAGEESAPVYATVAGTWQLTRLEGEPLDGNVCVYLVLNRRAIEDSDVDWREFEEYNNLISALPRKKTGLFLLKKDSDDRVFITGLYNYDLPPEWKHDYHVSLKGDEMTWTATDDTEYVMVYTRIESIPDKILEGATRAQ